MQTRSASLIPLSLLMLGLIGIGLTALLCQPGTQLGIHPNFTHPDQIDTVRSAFTESSCRPGSPEYHEYWSNGLNQFLYTCLRDNGLYAVWIVAKDGSAFKEITGFFSRIKYILQLIVRDGYIEICK